STVDPLKHRGQVDMMPCLTSVLVWGQEVSITPMEINFIYWYDPMRLGSGLRDFSHDGWMMIVLREN
ncbi:hypothetical protein HAX54_037000, partial [Datura stramonium]|nr:hypothetical protein [Datura stramonium]